MPPLHLRVVRDPQSGLSIYIENHAPVPPATSRNGRRAASAVTFEFLNQIRNVLGVKEPEQSFAIKATLTDEGQTHHRLTQTHRGLPVYGAELTVHQTNGAVTLVMGQYRPVPATLGVAPTLSVKQAGELALGDVGRKAIVQAFGQNLLKMQPVSGELCVYPGEPEPRPGWPTT